MSDLLPVPTVERVAVYAHSMGHGDRRAENIQIRYANGYGLSVARGHGMYSGETTFEVAVIQWAGDDSDHWEFAGSVLGWDDSIRGWQSEEELLALEREVAAL